MGAFLTVLLITSLTMSAVIVLSLLLNKVLINRVSPVFRYYTWLIVLVGLLIPFRPNVPLPFGRVSIPNAYVETGGGLTEAYAVTDARVSAPAGKEAASFSVEALFFAVWLCGAAFAIGFRLRAYFMFRASVRRWGTEPADAGVMAVLRSAQNGMRLSGKRIRVRECEFVSSPLLIGFFFPTILLPAEPISEDELTHIFTHELTHYKRGDMFVNLLTVIVSAAHWFNPLVYIMASAVREDCEAACDESVIADGCADTRRRYGETIIGFIRAGAAGGPVLSTYFYGGSKSMKKRLTSIMDTGKKSKGLALFGVTAVIAAVVISGNVFAEESGAEEAKTIALNHAGFTEAQVSKLEIDFDYESGTGVYEIDFENGNMEYEYEIDAATGDIIKADSEYDD